jgi:glutathione S-transferase
MLVVDNPGVSVTIAGDDSIADIAIWPWIPRFPRHKTDLNDLSM